MGLFREVFGFVKDLKEDSDFYKDLYADYDDEELCEELKKCEFVDVAKKMAIRSLLNQRGYSDS